MNARSGDEREAPRARRVAETPPASVEEALALARRHGRAATSEALAAVHALLDAAALAASGEPSDTHRLLAPLAQVLGDLEVRLAGDVAPAGGELLAAVAQALDAEIARWEARAREDREARAVLRAFLGIRELLWELGVRPGSAAGPAAPPASESTAPGEATPPRKAQRRSRRRVQRVTVQG